MWGAQVTSSWVGPQIGMHHQSLLIASTWIDGRGNLACGAPCPPTSYPDRYHDEARSTYGVCGAVHSAHTVHTGDIRRVIRSAGNLSLWHRL